MRALGDPAPAALRAAAAGALLLAVLLAATAAALRAQDRLTLRVVYAGATDLPRGAAFERFLRKSTTEVRAVPLGSLALSHLVGADVLIVDGNATQLDARNRPVPAEQAAPPLELLTAIPTVLIGRSAGVAGDRHGFKFALQHGDTTLQERLVVIAADHPLFAGPVKLPAEAFEDLPTPANHLSSSCGLPRTLRTVRIVDRIGDDPGFATAAAGYEDSPDAELIAGALAGSGPGFVAVARHGSLLMWGFNASPKDMTDAGRALFLNALAAIARHRGEPLLVRRTAKSRELLHQNLHVFAGNADTLRTLLAGAEVPADALASTDGLEKWWQSVRGYVRYGAADGQPVLDRDLQQLGVPNDRLAFFDAVVERLQRDERDGLSRLLLERYAPDAPVEGLAAWVAARRERLFFSDWGGYRWHVPGDAVAPSTGAAPSPTSR